MRRQGVVFICFFAVWLGVIFSMSAQPADRSNDVSLGFLEWLLMPFPSLLEQCRALDAHSLELVNTIVRKCAHFAEYALLGTFAAGTVVFTPVRRRLPIALGACAAAAGIDELIQLFTPGRACRALDVVIDSAGAAAGIIAVMLMVRASAKKRAADN